MEMNDVMTIITQVGFPIAMCLLMMWYIKDLTSSFKTSIDNNTKAIENLEKVILMKGEEKNE